MHKIISVLKKILIFIFFLLVVATIKMKLEGKKIMPYLIKYTNVNETNNYSKILFDYVTNNFLQNNVLYKTNNLMAGNLVNINSEPVCYIYNTHQKEEYATNTVLEASMYLKDQLLKKQISCIVEQSDIIAILNQRKLSYPYTYSITRELALKNMNTYGSLKILIDLHRDSAEKDITTIKINDKDYAKMMFLIGTNHPKYKENEANMNVMKSYLDDHYKGLMRNTYYQDDTYNQDISTTLFSIEVGANKNTFEEVQNSLDALSEAISHLFEMLNG